MKNNRCGPHIGRGDPPLIGGVRGDPPWMFTSRGDPPLIFERWGDPPEDKKNRCKSIINELIFTTISCQNGQRGRGMLNNDQ